MNSWRQHILILQPCRNKVLGVHREVDDNRALNQAGGYASDFAGRDESRWNLGGVEAAFQIFQVRRPE